MIKVNLFSIVKAGQINLFSVEKPSYPFLKDFKSNT